MSIKTKRKKPIIIGIILTYNCARLLENTLKKIPQEVFDQIIVSDDGSKDDIKNVAKKNKLLFFTHPHKGYGGNIKYGLQKALELGADYMVEIHGDGQYEYAAIPRALKKIQSGYDFLIGSRFTTLKQSLIEDKMPIARYAANIGLTLIAKTILQVNLTEVHSGFRVYSKKLLDTIGFQNTSNDHIYSFENLAQAKYYHLRITEIAVHCDYATEHTSISIKKSIFYSFDMFRVMTEFILAKMGFKSKLFKNLRRRNGDNKFTS